MLTKRAAETRTFSIPFLRKLNADELLSGTPTVNVSPSGPTITGIGLTVSATEPIGQTFFPTDKGVVFTVAGGTAGTEYTVRITAVTDAEYPQTLIQEQTLRVI